MNYSILFGSLCMGIIIIAMSSGRSIAQSDPDDGHSVWLTNDEGYAVYLDTGTMDWVPLSGREKIPLKTYILTHAGARITAYYQTSIYQLPNSGYLFLEDILEKNRDEMVRALTQIEAEQLPASVRPSDNTNPKIGVTYGSKGLAADSTINSFPYMEERMQALEWFLDKNRYDASLLILKRMMTRFPALYADQNKVDLLCSLYEQMELFGFLHSETQKLLQMEPSDEVRFLAQRWKEKTELRIRSQ